MNEHTSYQILLVEDNLVDRRLLRILLLNVPNFDIELIYVKTLADAIAHLDRTDFDAILLDLFLPDSRGLDTLTRLKKESLTRRQNSSEMPQLEQWQPLPPIIILTGLEDEETALKAIKVGAQDYLLKGELSSRLLMRTLHYSIERSKIEELLRQASEELDLELNRRTANLQISLNELEKEIVRRKQAESKLRQEQENLEALVQERTAELEARNQQLRQEIDRRQESETALKESEERFRHTFEQAEVGIAQVYPDGTFARVNQKLCQMLGYLPEELLQLNFREITHPEDFEISVERVNELLRRERTTYSLEKRYLHKDGSPVWIYLTVSLVWTEKGTSKHFVSIFQDISDRKKAEAILAQKNTELQVIFEAIPDLFFRISAEGQFLDCKTSNFSDLYVPPEVFLGKQITEVLPEEVAQKMQQTIDDALRDKSLVTVEYMLPIGDREDYFECRTVPFSEDEAVCIIRKISDRKQTELELRQSEAKQRALIESIPDLLIRMKSDGTYLEMICGERVEEVFHPNLKGGNANIYNIMPRKKAEERMFYIEQAISTGESLTYEYQLVLAEKVLEEEARIVPYGEDEVLMIIRDISDRKRAEEKLRQSETRNRALVQAIPDLLVRMKADGEYLDIINGGQLQMFAPDRSRISANIYDILSQDQARERMEYVQRALSTGEPQVYEYELVKDEKIWQEEARIVPCGEDEVLMIIRDISDRKQAEEKLRQSEARNRALVQAIPDLLIRMNTNGDYLDVISGGEVELFKPNKIHKNANLYNILPLNTAKEWMKCVQQALTTGKPQVYEYQLVKAEKTLEEEVRIVPCGEDEVLAMVRDISDRKRAEMERDRFFTQSLDLLCVAGFDGYFKRVNPSWEATLGYTREELMARPFLDFVHRRDRDATIEAAAQLAQGKNIVNFENRYQCKDGSYKWLSWHSTSFTQESLIYAVAHDVTEQKNYEANLERERQQLQQIVKNAPVAMAMFDRNMNYIAHSDRWLTDYELPDTSLVGWNYYDIFPDIPDRWREAHQRALQGEKLSHPEDMFLREDGQQFYLRWALHPWTESDGAIGGIVMVTDRIDQLVQAREAALENVRLKSQFLANMSHEIRTPMNGVLGMTELLLSTSLNNKQLDFVQTLRSSGENLLTIINDILDFSKLEAGEMRLDAHEFHLNSAIEDLLDLFTLQSCAKGVELIYIIEPDVPVYLKGDAARLRQVLTNLIGNALKFTERGEITLSIIKEQLSINNEGQSNNKLRFAIQDTGIGISAVGQKKLFQSFSQVDASNTRKYGGTGLGLAICKELVQLMGGEIGVESIPDRGSTFWFTAIFDPLNPEEEDNAFPRKKTQTSISTLTGKKLLVVDDNATNRKIVRLQAKAWGMEVDDAENGTVALAILRLAVVLDKSYDLVLLDMQMPEMTGEMLGRQIRSEVDIAQTRLIMMTSIDERDLISRLEEIGFDGYLLKPIVTSRLLNSLLNAIEQVPIQDILPSLSPAKQEEITCPIAPIEGKILVVEDTLVNQKVVLNQLQLLGYKADCASDGREALEQWSIGNYTLLFMDCQMPVMDGYQATQTIRQREGEDKHIIIVGLTAYAMKGDREKCLEAGMDDYLSKPVSKQDLSVMLEKWLSASINPSLSTSTSILPTTQEESEEGKQLIDLEQFDAITDGDRDFQMELLQSFIDDAEMDLLQAKQALKSEDSLTLGQKAHRIKGAAANLAITELSQITATLEKQAKEQQFLGMETLLDRVEVLLEEVKQFLLTMENEEESIGETETTHNQLLLSDSHSLIDRQLLQSISGGDRNFEVELFNAFLLDIEAELQTAKAALEVENYAELIQRGSSFKSAAESVAVGFVPDLARRLVKAASQENRELVAVVLKELEQVLKRVKIELN
ncbi:MULTISPECIES: PAS domain S-box protein [Spirulina sp. CCY15215]|uniref:PAS domain S-box protein n=1 Tax=Spirulina sp. CCY15215 TaxID=2767591 RepID=UPI00194F0BC5|nr:PAS domain S-box protein [Spirulina major]